MRIRCLLDGIAALQFLLKGDVSNMKAIFKARREFHRLKKQYAPIRQRIQSARTIQHIPERTGFSLLWQYFVKGHKTFSSLPM
jgi:hypothetical protein